MSRGINAAGRRAVWALYPIAIGEIWTVGPHRVLCADFREATGYGWLDRLFDGKTPSVDIVDTSPYASPQAFAQIARQAGRGIKSINLDDLPSVVSAHVASLQPKGGIVAVRAPDRYRLLYQTALTNLRYHFVQEEEDRFLNHPNAAPRKRLVMGRTLPDDKNLTPQEGGVLYDPMCGTGPSLLTFAKDFQVLGVEISPLRAAYAIHRLGSALGVEPKPLDW